MESANLHHQQYQLQDQLVGSSSSLATPSWYGVHGSNHAWTPNNILNTGNFNQNISRDLYESSRDYSRQKNDIIIPPLLNNSMIQDLGFHWTSQSVHDLQHLSKIKEELSSDSFPKFTEMINSSSTTIEEDLHLPPASYIKNEHRDFDDLSEKLLLKTLSSGSQINGHQHFSNAQNCSSFGDGGAMPSRGNFSQIFPSVNISNLNQSSASPISNNLDMTLQALDLMSTSARFSGSINQPPSHDNLSFGLDHMQQLTRMPSNNPNKISPFINGVTEAKRPNSYMDPKASSKASAATKKSRLEPRASCPPFKVRKEKLGDRIAALQQLVAPFGKTDTASVLMEAIGYIKFLQNQVETLSVPYMKSSRNRNCRTMHMGQIEENENEEAKPDLRSRGLCLVPLSCMSYITNDGGGVWPPTDYSGGT